MREKLYSFWRFNTTGHDKGNDYIANSCQSWVKKYRDSTVQWLAAISELEIG